MRAGPFEQWRHQIAESDSKDVAQTSVKLDKTHNDSEPKPEEEKAEQEASGLEDELP